MKITRNLMMAVAAAALSAFAIPANAQSRSHGSNWHGNNWHGGNWHGGNRWFYGGNFFVGGFGYPYFGYPYWGSPFYSGYPYGYAVGGHPVGGYPVGAYYTYDPRGVYQGKVVNPNRSTHQGSEDFSLTAHVQQQLATAGYYRGAIDGIAGDGTRRAIRNYEHDNGLHVDGQIDNQLLATMGHG